MYFSFFLFAFLWHVSLVLVVILVVCIAGASRCTCVWGGETPCICELVDIFLWHEVMCVREREREGGSWGAYSIKRFIFTPKIEMEQQGEQQSVNRV